MVGDQVLRLPDELHELADPAIAAAELDDQLPSQRIAEQSEDLRPSRFDTPSSDGGPHRTHTTSTGFDASSEFDVYCITRLKDASTCSKERARRGRSEGVDAAA